MYNYDKESKLEVAIDTNTYSTTEVQIPTREYIKSTLKSTTATLESSINALEDKINTKMKTQVETFKHGLDERDKKIQNLNNELNEMSRLITHLIKHGSKTAHCEIILLQNNPLSMFNVVNYKIKFNFINDSYKYDEYEFELDDLTGSNIRLRLCKLKNIGKDRIKVKIKVYDSSNELIKKLKYIVDIKGKKFIQL